MTTRPSEGFAESTTISEGHAVSKKRRKHHSISRRRQLGSRKKKRSQPKAKDAKATARVALTMATATTTATPEREDVSRNEVTMEKRVTRQKSNAGVAAMPPFRNDIDIDTYSSSDTDLHDVQTPLLPRHMLKDDQGYDSDVDSDFKDASDGDYSEYSVASMEDDDWEEEICDPTVEDAMFLRMTSQESKKLFNEKARRIAIAYIFMNKYGGMKSHGVMTKIQKDIGIPLGTKIDKVLDAVIHCKCTGVIYTGERYKSDKQGPMCKIAIES